MKILFFSVELLCIFAFSRCTQSIEEHQFPIRTVIRVEKGVAPMQYAVIEFTTNERMCDSTDMDGKYVAPCEKENSDSISFFIIHPAIAYFPNTPICIDHFKLDPDPYDHVLPLSYRCPSTNTSFDDVYDVQLPQLTFRVVPSQQGWNEEKRQILIKVLNTAHVVCIGDEFCDRVSSSSVSSQ